MNLMSCAFGIKIDSVKKRAALLAALSLATASVLSAHEDPIGDVHPNVRVEKGNFAIYFSNNSERGELAEEPPIFRTVYSSGGELLAPRHRVPTIPQDDQRISRRGLNGIEIQAGEETLVFPPYPRLFHDKPYYTVESGDHAERRRLAWPDAVKISELHNVIADKDSITIAAKAGTDELDLYHFRRDRFELPLIARIGNPLNIYDFPVASNLVFAGGKYWIAWMRANEKERKAEAVLSSWRPGDKDALEAVLDGPGNWNSHLSMAASGDSLCIAYHCSNNVRYGRESRIYKIFQAMK